MVKRTSFWDAGCPVARALDVIGDWWSLLIIRDAFDHVRRFNEFQTSLGISKGILATRLRDLIERGIFKIESASDGSAYKQYALTDKGRALFLVIVALRQWGEEHLYTQGKPRSVLVEIETGVPVRRLELHAESGRRLEWSDTEVQKQDAKGALQS